VTRTRSPCSDTCCSRAKASSGLSRRARPGCRRPATRGTSPVSAQVYFELAALEKRQPEGLASIAAKKQADEHRLKLSEAERAEVNARVARERIQLL
jgi:hypothetical protein